MRTLPAGSSEKLRWVAVGHTAFTDPLRLKLGEFEATGTFEFARYPIAHMYVGLIQIEGPEGDRTVTAGAYGMGPPEINEGVGADDEHGWSLYLQKDSSGGDFDPEKPAYGFVVGVVAGGKLMGWLHDGITLEIVQQEDR
jgi:hypothetical protein